ncbi:MAG TPA: RNA-binding S4 domain-containing protein [Sphingobacteriaceae bacterium]|nr:RNA-binding S4 domain-containing protein [Sphingobacteriaceae bacterium]
MHTFRISKDYIHMIQLLKALNWVETGGHAQLVVMDGLVRYNGNVDRRKRLKVKAGDVVEFEGKKVKIIAKNGD